MSESGHTPGPWSVHKSIVPHDGEFDYAISAEGVPCLAEAFGRSAIGGFAPAAENARLIAAAPELLEALKALVLDWEWLDIDNPEMRVGMARKAISKAEGKS